MEKIFIYDRYGLELLSCQFAGVSVEGKPKEEDLGMFSKVEEIGSEY